jgi:hypothetical protein
MEWIPSLDVSARRHQARSFSDLLAFAESSGAYPLSAQL